MKAKVRNKTKRLLKGAIGVILTLSCVFFSLAFLITEVLVMRLIFGFELLVLVVNAQKTIKWLGKKLSISAEAISRVANAFMLIFIGAAICTYLILNVAHGFSIFPVVFVFPVILQIAYNKL